MPGRTYNGKLCWFLLEEPADAYEWSFVAVPAQREAGVTKGFAEEEEGLRTLAELRKCRGGLRLSPGDVAALQNELAGLEALAACGQRQQDRLVQQVIRTAAVLQPGLKAEIIRKSLAALTPEELETVADNCRRAMGQEPAPQLAAAPKKETANRDFVI